MYRVTTPKHTFSLPQDISIYKVIEITYTQKDKGVKIIKLYNDGECDPGVTVDGQKVIVKLSQEETKKFSAKQYVTVQLRSLTYAGDVGASRIFRVGVEEVQSEEILT